MNKCDKCAHKEICIHKKGYDSLVKRIDNAMPGEEMIGMGERYPFSVEIKCKCFMEQEKFIRDRLLQQQYGLQQTDYTKSTVNPNFYGYYRDES
jgi:hypothetical protein